MAGMSPCGKPPDRLGVAAAPFLLQKSRQNTQNIGVSIGIAIAVAIAIGLARVLMPIAALFQKSAAEQIQSRARQQADGGQVTGRAGTALSIEGSNLR